MNEKRLLDIRARLTGAQQEQARAQVLRDNALEAKEKVMARLKEEFGVDTVDEARVLFKKLESSLSADLLAIEKILDSLDA